QTSADDRQSGTSSLSRKGAALRTLEVTTTLVEPASLLGQEAQAKMDRRITCLEVQGPAKVLFRLDILSSLQEDLGQPQPGGSAVGISAFGQLRGAAQVRQRCVRVPRQQGFAA